MVEAEQVIFTYSTAKLEVPKSGKVEGYKNKSLEMHLWAWCL